MKQFLKSAVLFTIIPLAQSQVGSRAGCDNVHPMPGCEPPAAPTLLSVEDRGPTSGNDCAVFVTWADNSSDESGFQVEFQPQGSRVWTVLGTAPVDSVSGLFNISIYPKIGIFRVLALGPFDSPYSASMVGSCKED